jgi:peptide/nickel transport system substrate-binding protein
MIPYIAALLVAVVVAAVTPDASAETLVTLDEKMQVRPVLAERWERINDRTMRFHLRKGVTFHDGTPFNAAAVKFTLDRVLDPKTPARGRSWLGPVTGATVVDDTTVDVLTSSPFGPLLNHLTMVFVVGIVRPDAVKKFGDDFGRNPVGTGPFRFEEWKSNQSIVLAAGFVLVNLLTDLSYTLLDPRIRYEHRA